jgi:Ger(x)C family germination protein
MRSSHVKNTTRYYLIIVALLLFLFFSGDFGLIDAQKTAIVMAVGIDREEDTFIVTSQIAVPQTSQQGESSKTVQLVSRGKTVADAFEEINSKTGWYPKLVFCKLIILGEQTAKQNVFDALDFFLLDEYLSDSCLVATCDGTAKQLLNTSALIEQSNSSAMQKVLSPHAERVGSVLPSTLRDFAIGYFSDAGAGFLPVLKTQPQQEQIGGESNSTKQASQGNTDGQAMQGAGEKQQTSQKPVFSAGETALFVRGKRVGTLTEEETFAFNVMHAELKLAAYSVDVDGKACTLNIKNNRIQKKVRLGQDGRATLQLTIKLTAGLLDYSQSLPLQKIKDAGSPPDGTFAAAEKRLMGQIHTAFEKCKACQCDIFGLQEWLQKYKFSQYKQQKDDIFSSAVLDISVQFRSIR